MQKHISETDTWTKKWERGLKVQKAVSYSDAIGVRFEKNFGKAIFNWLYVFDEGGASSMYVKSRERDDFRAYYLSRFARDTDFLKQFNDDFVDHYRPHFDFLHSINLSHLEALSDEKLWQLFADYKTSLSLFFSYHWGAIIWEPIIEETAYTLLKKRFETNAVEEKITIIFSITSPNYVLREERDLSAVSQLSTREKEAALNAHAEKYAYMPLYDYDYAPYTIEYFRSRLSLIDPAETVSKLARIEENAKQFDTFLQEHRFTAQEHTLLKALHFLFNHKDERSHYRSLDSFLGRKIYEEIGRRIGMSLGDIMFLLDEEIGAALMKGTKTDVTGRKKKHCLIYEHGRVRILTGATMDEYMRDHVARESKGDVSGLSVSPGKARGTARIIRTIADLSSVQDGDVLVTSMTRPDYVLAMKKCAAIVTDEGGILCHAAIVSRELNKPCIVGTRNATQVLKDGDKVEVDADTGVVRKIVL